MNTFIPEDKFFDQSRRRRINTLIWIPGYSNVEGNENSDQVSKSAVKSTYTPKLNITAYPDIKKRNQRIHSNKNGSLTGSNKTLN
ncbi:unnamed protein product [Macrosiphum euphorbiae]|uniref:Uncharacterized protein n=1 Tax=Macrosiphum euphorbiae TaxID=13131 RepID=A0AAV0WYL2_9HEMI|nr:unnamed protein product [Macrosiphum euphorbiae]